MAERVLKIKTNPQTKDIEMGSSMVFKDGRFRKKGSLYKKLSYTKFNAQAIKQEHKNLVQ